MPGSIGAGLSTGGIDHSESIGVALVVAIGGLGGGKVPVPVSRLHPAPSVRDKIRIRDLSSEQPLKVKAKTNFRQI